MGEVEYYILENRLIKNSCNVLISERVFCFNEKENVFYFNSKREIFESNDIFFMVARIKDGEYSIVILDIIYMYK